MSFRVWFKTVGADRVLAPLRMQLVELIPEGATVLEVGCGTGDLLFKAAAGIRQGVGVDLDPAMIRHATGKAASDIRWVHLQFRRDDLMTLQVNQRFDVTTATLCIHELGVGDAVTALQQLAAVSKLVIIADYKATSSWMELIMTEVDEMLSGHYQAFRQYRSSGGMPYLVEQAGLSINQTHDTRFGSLGIWEIS